MDMEESPLNNLTNLVSVERPASSQEITEQRVFVDEVSWGEREGTSYILIRGNFPNPCCRLHEVTESVSGNEIQLSMTAWQPAGTMCSQVLEPFSYLHPVPEEVNPEESLTVTINESNAFVIVK
ncbi:MAG: hypothetical protein WD599_07285 [Balneolaceae bacterium]